MSGLSEVNNGLFNVSGFVVSSLMNWFPVVIISFLILWWVQSFFDYVVYRVRYSMTNSLSSATSVSSVLSKVNYDSSLKTEASLLLLHDKDDLVDYSSFNSFFESDWPYSKYWIDKSIWENAGADKFYDSGRYDEFDDDFLLSMRNRSRDMYWESVDMADIPHSEKVKKYNAYCKLQDDFAYHKFIG